MAVNSTKIACQDLLSSEADRILCSGWLRRRHVLDDSKLSKLSSKLGQSIKKLNNLKDKLIPWFQKYVVLCEDLIYCYKSEREKKPQKVIDLKGYTGVDRAKDISQFEVPWAFKIEYCEDEHFTQYFAASSEKEMQEWIGHIRAALPSQGISCEPPTRPPRKQDLEDRAAPDLPEDESDDDDDDYSHLDYDEMVDEELTDHIAEMRLKKSHVMPEDVMRRSQVHGPPARRPWEAPAKKRQPTYADRSSAEDKEEEHDVKGIAHQLEKQLHGKLPIGARPLLHPKPGVPSKVHTSSPPVATIKPNHRKISEDAPPTAPKPKLGPRSWSEGTAPKERSLFDRYYWPHTDRSGAISMLKELDVTGAYLIRPSEKAGQKTLVVYNNGEVKQYKVMMDSDANYHIVSTEQFPSLDELVEHYSNNELPGNSAGLALETPYGDIA